MTPLEQALSRAKGLALQNKQLKRSNHQLHVSLQKEIDNRIKGEKLRERIRALEFDCNILRTAHHDGFESCKFCDELIEINWGKE